MRCRSCDISLCLSLLHSGERDYSLEIYEWVNILVYRGIGLMGYYIDRWKEPEPVAWEMSLLSEKGGKMVCKKDIPARDLTK